MIPVNVPTYTDLDYKSAREAKLFLDSDIRAFEEEFAAYLGCTGVVAVNSGTAALRILTGVMPRPRRITIPTYTCRSLLNSLDHLPFLADNTSDVEHADFNIDGSAAGSIIVTETFGLPTPASPHIMVRDITHAPVAGSSPEYAVCSLGRDKMLTTQRGGIIASNNQAVLDECRARAYYELSDNEPVYRSAESAGMTNLQAALGRSQLRQLPYFIERRRGIAARYSKAFTNVGIPCPDPDCGSVFWRYIIQTPDAATTIAQLADHGIQAGYGVNPPLHRILGTNTDKFPGADHAWKHNVSIPIYPSLTGQNIQLIIQSVINTCAPSPSSKPA